MACLARESERGSQARDGGDLEVTIQCHTGRMYKSLPAAKRKATHTSDRPPHQYRRHESRLAPPVNPFVGVFGVTGFIVGSVDAVELRDPTAAASGTGAVDEPRETTVKPFGPSGPASRATWASSAATVRIVLGLVVVFCTTAPTLGSATAPVPVGLPCSIASPSLRAPSTSAEPVGDGGPAKDALLLGAGPPASVAGAETPPVGAGATASVLGAGTGAPVLAPGAGASVLGPGAGVPELGAAAGPGAGPGAGPASLTVSSQVGGV